jgi:hypothetical protein
LVSAIPSDAQKDERRLEVTPLERRFGLLQESDSRSAANYFVNLLGGLVAYTWREKKPSLNIRLKEQSQLVF